MHDPTAAPSTPYADYLPRLLAELEADIAAAEPLRSPHAGASPDLRERARAEVEARAPDLFALSHDIHANPELGVDEHHAAAAVGRALEACGRDVEIGGWGLDTAVHARVGSGGPRVAFLAEYDALPGIGHACGHNVICATAVGAFLATAALVEEVGGTVELIGCPGEEGGGGKEYIARAGGFDGVDAALMLHPFGADAAEHTWLGVRTVDVTFHGLPAHAAMMPHLGRNALDAAVNAYLGLAQMRQHMLPGDRVHGIITDGGQKPNIVPERAAVSVYLRSADPGGLAELSSKATAVFEGAALATGTRAELAWDPCPVYLPVRNNHALAARYADNLAGRGRKVLPRGVLPRELTGSTDMGNVSVRVPGIHPLLAIAPPTVSIHSPEFTDWAASSRADEATVDGAFGLAATALDFLADDALRTSARDEFEAAGGAVDVDELLGGA